MLFLKMKYRLNVFLILIKLDRKNDLYKATQDRNQKMQLAICCFLFVVCQLYVAKVNGLNKQIFEIGYNCG